MASDWFDAEAQSVIMINPIAEAGDWPTKSMIPALRLRGCLWRKVLLEMRQWLDHQMPSVLVTKCSWDVVLFRLWIGSAGVVELASCKMPESVPPSDLIGRLIRSAPAHESDVSA